MEGLSVPVGLSISMWTRPICPYSWRRAASATPRTALARVFSESSVGALQLGVAEPVGIASEEVRPCPLRRTWCVSGISRCGFSVERWCFHRIRDGGVAMLVPR